MSRRTPYTELRVVRFVEDGAVIYQAVLGFWVYRAVRRHFHHEKSYGFFGTRAEARAAIETDDARADLKVRQVGRREIEGGRAQ